MQALSRQNMKGTCESMHFTCGILNIYMLLFILKYYVYT